MFGLWPCLENIMNALSSTPVITPSIFEPHRIVAAQSTRHGGLSAKPFDSLNLGLSVGDDPATVEQNRKLVCQHLGIDVGQLAFSRQVHGAEVLRADAPQQAEGYDAVVTATPGVFAVVSVADCTPVLIYDPVRGVSAAIHAGWKGTVARIVCKTLERMHSWYGTNPSDCVAWIGACIGPDAFEVDADVADHFPDTEKRFDPTKEKFYVDLKTANKHQLLAMGLPAQHIEVSSYCTIRNNDLFFSHRAGKGQTGRMWAIIGRHA